MNTYHNVIVYLWLAPVLVLIVIPLLFSLSAELYRAIERFRLADVRGYVAKAKGETSGPGSSEKRSLDRIRLEEGQAYITEEHDCCKAHVANISKDGICLKDIPDNVELKSRLLRVVFRTREKDYDFTAKPVWKKQSGEGYEIGAEIERTPSGWKELVRGFSRPLATA